MEGKGRSEERETDNRVRVALENICFFLTCHLKRKGGFKDKRVSNVLLGDPAKKGVSNVNQPTPTTTETFHPCPLPY